ncbi:2,3-diaminopropionate biosynthesis protein SbnB [Kitasatospora sp. LaBMicrA B282]|uniref:2,3-diaminopropionate biosynthesis protein SbnB n=1 Tax=Kitasatospora sp. LaBMicrA B282 TaxID=3420949 RepID=UPI003D0F759C
MSTSSVVPPFAVISGAQVNGVLEGRQKEVVDIVEQAYRIHGEGATVNPPSYFLKFPDRPSSRIIALPASIGGEVQVDGLKWISSFPENVEAGIPRASAVLILNDHATGYPIACLESSIISAARTAASAALAAAKLAESRGERPRRVGFVGTGLIARYLHSYLAGTGWDFDAAGVYDLSAEYAAGFADYLERSGGAGEVTVHDSAQSLIAASDLVVFATIAGTPHVHDPAWFAHNPLVLHVSLRDLSPEVILAATNITDDVEHCLKADTSLHLTEQRLGHRDFVDGTLHDVLTGKVRPAADRPVIFSPFGLGVLDLAVGKHVLDSVRASGELAVVEDFFHELRRHG